LRAIIGSSAQTVAVLASVSTAHLGQVEEIPLEQVVVDLGRGGSACWGNSARS
jgi:hypothetical protein